MLVKKIDTYADFWREIVTEDHTAFKAQIDDIRLAFHLAISLFHMADWIYINNKAYIDLNFTFRDRNGAAQPVSDQKSFANALRDMNPNFELIRGIANAAKHLQLHNPTTHHSHAPSHAANTAVHSTGWGVGGYGVGPYGGAPRVMLEGPSNNHLEFLDIAEDVFKMWQQLAASHNWNL